MYPCLATCTDPSIESEPSKIVEARLFRRRVDVPAFFHSQVTLFSLAHSRCDCHTMAASRKVFRVSKATAILFSLLLPHRYGILLHFFRAGATGSCMRGLMSKGPNGEARLILIFAGSSETCLRSPHSLPPFSVLLAATRSLKSENQESSTCLVDSFLRVGSRALLF